MKQENHKFYQIERIKESYIQLQLLIEGKEKESLNRGELVGTFNKEFMLPIKMIKKGILNRYKYVAIGVTKAGKSTLMNGLIGQSVLPS